MSEKATLSVVIPKDSEVYEEFEEWTEKRGHTSTSEALRDVMRKQFGPDAPPERRPAFELVTSTASVLSGVAIVFALMVGVGFLPFAEGMALAASTLATAGVLALLVRAGVIARVDQAIAQRRREPPQNARNEVEL